MESSKGILIAKVKSKILIIRERVYNELNIISPSSYCGFPKGEVYKDANNMPVETLKQAAIREFVEEIGTLPDDNIESLNVESLSGAYIWNINEQKANEILQTYYYGPRYIKRVRYGKEIPADWELVKTVGIMYSFYSVPGAACQEMESYFPRFININMNFNKPNNQKCFKTENENIKLKLNNISKIIKNRLCNGT